MPGTNAPTTKLDSSRAASEAVTQRHRDSYGLDQKCRSQRSPKSDPITGMSGDHRPNNRAHAEHDPAERSRLNAAPEVSCDVIDQEHHMRDQPDRVECIFEIQSPKGSR